MTKIEEKKLEIKKIEVQADTKEKVIEAEGKKEERIIHRLSILTISIGVILLLIVIVIKAL